jgi:DNA-binding NarL/FixJ family response regulator
MKKNKATLRQACKDRRLPSEPTVLGYADANPSFRKKLVDTYHSLPYAVQARADMFSPQFFKDLNRLKRKGLNFTEIAEKLQVSRKTVVRRFKGLKRT